MTKPDPSHDLINEVLLWMPPINGHSSMGGERGSHLYFGRVDFDKSELLDIVKSFVTQALGPLGLAHDNVDESHH